MGEKRRMVLGHVTIDETSRIKLLDGLKFDPTKAVNIGCGRDYIKGWVNVDGDPIISPDIVCELDSKNVRLPFEDNSMDLVYACHILEHIHYLPELKREFVRILKPGGAIFVVVPHYLSADAWGDDTHCRGFSYHSFYANFWPGTQKEFKFMELYIPGDPRAGSAQTFSVYEKGELLWLSALRYKNE